MSPDTPRPTLTHIGNYELIEKIAEGGMGTVYKGRQKQTGQIVAVKVVAAHIKSNPILLRRFEQEYRTGQQLQHPNIVRAIEFGGQDDTPYLVMEYVDGDSLGRKIERDGPIPEREAIRIIAQVAQALHRAHKENLVHRDVKPDNILIGSDGQAKLTDMGLVKEMDADLNLTRTGRGLGTPHFMAPEQFKNAKNANAKCDIYSLGATLYMMVTGEMPFRSSGPLEAYMKKIENKLPPPREITQGLSERIDWAIMRAMSAEPDARPASCREFVEDLTGRSTRKPATPAAAATAPQDVWYLVYKDEEGVSHTVKGTTAGIVRGLKESLLGDASNIRASRVKTGPFESLRAYPEFRHLVVGPAALPTSSPSLGGQQTGSGSKERPKASPASSSGDGQVTTPSGQRRRQPAAQVEVAEKNGRKPMPKWVMPLVFLLVVAALSFVVGFFILPSF